MSYPESSDVAGGQPTASAHYNNLRKDAVYMGNVSADSVDLGTFLQSFIYNLDLEILGTTKLRVPFDSTRPACIMIDGCMLTAASDIDLASAIAGAAATQYIFAVRTAGLTSFTIAVNTSPVPAANQRLIGECYWDGAAIQEPSIHPYTFSYVDLVREPDYDSGWFAVTHTTLYTKAHGLGAFPTRVDFWWSSVADWSAISHRPLVADGTATKGLMACDETNVYLQSGNNATAGTLWNTLSMSAGGYYLIRAWR